MEKNKYNCGNCSAIIIEKNGTTKKIRICPVCGCDTLVETKREN